MTLVSEGRKITLFCECGECGPRKKKQPLSTHIHVDISTQIEELFKTPRMAQALRHRFSRIKSDPQAVEDIFDGDAYKELCSDNGFFHVREPNNLESDINVSLTM